MHHTCTCPGLSLIENQQPPCRHARMQCAAWTSRDRPSSLTSTAEFDTSWMRMIHNLGMSTHPHQLNTSIAEDRKIFRTEISELKSFNAEFKQSIAGSIPALHNHSTNTLSDITNIWEYEGGVYIHASITQPSCLTHNLEKFNTVVE